MLVNDDIQIGNFEYSYINFFYNTSWLIFIIITSIVCYSKPFLILFKFIISHHYGLFIKKSNIMITSTSTLPSFICGNKTSSLLPFNYNFWSWIIIIDSFPCSFIILTQFFSVIIWWLHISLVEALSLYKKEERDTPIPLFCH